MTATVVLTSAAKSKEKKSKVEAFSSTLYFLDVQVRSTWTKWILEFKNQRGQGVQDDTDGNEIRPVHDY